MEITYKNDINSHLGGDCPKNTNHESEILQSVSSSNDSCLPPDCNGLFSGVQTSKSSNDAYKLKVENLKERILGQPGGG